MCARKLLFLGVLAACGKSGESRPDPWASPAAPSTDKLGSDPWATNTPAVAADPAYEPASSRALDGHYACQMPTTKYNTYSHMTEVTYVPAGLEFWLDGNRYKSRGAAGTVAINTHDDGRTYIVIRKDLKGDPRPGETTKFGDFYCGKQSS